ncbi:MAG: hypothetical protein KAJ40_04425 [Alphaproteobacteria bacterium]|nr:hypothetical protein [Alphaproteobacteria bacterium]
MNYRKNTFLEMVKEGKPDCVLFQFVYQAVWFIFSHGYGIRKETPVEHMKMMVKIIKEQGAPG